MKKIKAVFAFLCIMLFTPAAFAAPSSHDLVAHALSGGSTLTFSVPDMSALEKECNGRSIFASVMRSSLFDGAEYGRLFTDSAMCAELDLAGASLRDVVFAGRLKKGSVLPEMFFDIPSEKLTLSSEDGGTLEILGKIDSGVDGIVFTVADLKRDGESYVVLVSGGVDVMKRLLGKCPGTATVLSGQIILEIKTPAPNFEDSAPRHTYRGEFALDSDEKTVYVHAYANISEYLGKLCGEDIKALLSGGSPVISPIVIGGDPVLMVKNLSLACLPENLSLADFFSGSGLREAEARVNEALGAVGMDFSDLVAILRGNITFGVGGHLSFAGRNYPGVWLNLSGVPEHLKAMLPMLGIALGASPYEAGGTKGIAITSPVSAVAAFGDNGLLVALMDKDEIMKKPDISVLSAEALKPHALSCSINVKDAAEAVLAHGDELRALGKLFDMDDEEWLAMYGNFVSFFLENLPTLANFITKMSVYSDGFDALTLELEMPGVVPMLEFFN